MKRSGALRRLVGFVVAAAFLLSAAAPARAQLDPITLSLIMSGLQVIGGAVSMISIGVASDTRKGIALPYGTPCGIVDGVPQICWQPHAGGFEGSPDLPTHGGGKPAQQQAGPTAPVLTPTLSLSLAPTPAPGLSPLQVQGQ